jgi:pyruvate/2-oxoglutarate/acetoin dehydrogenase E1 component
MKYFDELKRSMNFLASHPDTIFIGQAVEYAGTAMTNTLKDVPDSKKLELPVCEDLQAGITNGLALSGKIPISIYPRWNFFLLATNQVVSHLDKIQMISDYKTKAIIRTGIGSIRPMHPQHQHVGDFTEAFKLMLSNIDVIRLDEPEDIFPAYEKALNRTDGKSTILVEWGDFYNEK